MKKRIIIGDMHGRFNIIKDIYDKEQPNDVITLGDYVDSHEISNASDIKYAFEQLLNLRQEHINNNKGIFTMLLGNHDFHYIMDGEQYSGFNYHTYHWANHDIYELVSKGSIKICFIDEINKTIYSHAGVSNSFLNETCVRPISNPNGSKLTDINHLPLDYFVFELTFGYSIYGDTIWNGPLWIRPRSLSKDPYKDENGNVWTQIVGHTMMTEPTWVDTDNEETNNKILLLDSLSDGYYLVETIDDNGIIIERKISKL